MLSPEHYYVGTPDDILAAITESQARLGYEELIFWARPPGMPIEQATESLELIARHVLPGLREAASRSPSSDDGRTGRQGRPGDRRVRPGSGRASPGCWPAAGAQGGDRRPGPAAAAQAAAGLPGEAPRAAVGMDVTSRDSADAAVTRVEAELGPVGVVVNNAGVSSVTPFLEITDADWDRLMNVNLRGVLVVTQRVLGPMLARGGRSGHQHLLDGGQGGPAEPVALLRDEVRRDRPDPVAGQGGRRPRHHRQRGLPGRGADAAVGRPGHRDPARSSTARAAGTRSSAASRSVGPSLPEDIGHACAYLASDLGANITGEALNVSGGQQMH